MGNYEQSLKLNKEEFKKELADFKKEIEENCKEVDRSINSLFKILIFNVGKTFSNIKILFQEYKMHFEDDSTFYNESGKYVATLSIKDGSGECILINENDKNLTESEKKSFKEFKEKYTKLLNQSRKQRANIHDNIKNIEKTFDDIIVELTNYFKKSAYKTK